MWSVAFPWTLLVNNSQHEPADTYWDDVYRAAPKSPPPGSVCAVKGRVLASAGVHSRPCIVGQRAHADTQLCPVVWMWTLGHGASWLQRHSFCTRHRQPCTRVNSFPAWPPGLFQLHISIWQPRPRTEWLRRQAYQECLFTPPPSPPPPLPPPPPPPHRHRFFFFSKQAFRLLSILYSCPSAGTIPAVSRGHSFISRYTDSLSVSSCLKKSPHFSLNIDLII